jgi:hypothetical protein
VCHETLGARARLISFAAVEESNIVSWQSAFWPVAACTTAVIFQNTGRVLSAPYKLSYALRASPLICTVNTLQMIIKFSWMLLVGCLFRAAARHIWYDPFVVKTWLCQGYPRCTWGRCGVLSPFLAPNVYHKKPFDRSWQPCPRLKRRCEWGNIFGKISHVQRLAYWRILEGPPRPSLTFLKITEITLNNNRGSSSLW